MPPVAATVRLYDVPTVPDVSDAVVTLTGEATAIDSARVALAPRLSSARTVNEAVPEVEGVPVMLPPLVRTSPTGRDPALTLHE